MTAQQALTTASTVYSGALTAAAATQVVPIDNPTMFDLGGVLVPIVPVAVGVLTALLVRVVVSTKSQREALPYNIAITMLAMLMAAVTITDHKLGAGTSMWIGGGFGASAVLLVEIFKRRFLAAIGVKEDELDNPDDSPPKP